LKPPSGISIPDIPYGQGRGPSQRKSTASRAVSGASIASTTATAPNKEKAKARTFTPSVIATGLRIDNNPQQEEKNKALQENTTRNAGGGGNAGSVGQKGDYNLVTVASSSQQQQQQPATSLVSPSAPLTVNAAVVPAQSGKITQIDQSNLQDWQQAQGGGNSGKEGGSAAVPGISSVLSPQSSPSKQPAKSALKGQQQPARSWADLVRPMNNVQLAQQAVRNAGLTEEEVASRGENEGLATSFDGYAEARAANEAAKKKRVSYALPSTASNGSPNTATPVKTATNDKPPKHVSPPPVEKKEVSAAAEAGQETDARSMTSNVTSASTVFGQVMSRKKTLEEILSGVENSKSSIMLYPRGLVNTGNACFMNSILQTLLFTAPFYNLISLIGTNTAEDLAGRTPLLDAMVAYLGEFRTSDPIKEFQLNNGRSYEEELSRNDAFVPSIIYHALNKNTRFAQMGFSNPSSPAQSVLSNGGGHSRQNSNAPMGNTGKYGSASSSSNHLSQEDAQEFLGFFLDTIHDELLLKTEAFDKQIWEKASKGFRAGMDSLTRQSVNGAAAFDSISAPASQNPAHSSAVQPSSASITAPSARAGDDDDWLEVGQKGRTATTRTTEHQESAITRIFGGQLRSVLRCPGQKDSVTLEPYMSLQLEIQEPQIYSVEDALGLIARPETLSDVANKNNVKVDATKQVFIEHLPPVLILHLKRFIYNPKAGGTLKSHKAISYGTELEIPKECLAPTKRAHVGSEKTRYRLNGVVYHHGKSAAGGHYTAQLRQSNGRWVNIDDTTITPVSEDEVATDRDKEQMRLSLPSAAGLRGIPEKSAYLLFYQRI